MPSTTGQTANPTSVLHVAVTRPMWGEFFTLTLDNGFTEELEPEEVRIWFKVRGADMDKIEKALDQCWNFQSCEVNIQNPKEPPVIRLPHTPDI